MSTPRSVFARRRPTIDLDSEDREGPSGDLQAKIGIGRDDTRRAASRAPCGDRVRPCDRSVDVVRVDRVGGVDHRRGVGLVLKLLRRDVVEDVGVCRRVREGDDAVVDRRLGPVEGDLARCTLVLKLDLVLNAWVGDDAVGLSVEV
jgi:hypothetical protein